MEDEKSPQPGMSPLAPLAGRLYTLPANGRGTMVHCTSANDILVGIVLGELSSRLDSW